MFFTVFLYSLQNFFIEIKLLSLTQINYYHPFIIISHANVYSAISITFDFEKHNLILLIRKNNQ